MNVTNRRIAGRNSKGSPTRRGLYGEEQQSGQDAKCATQRGFGPPWPGLICGPAIPSASVPPRQTDALGACQSRSGAERYSGFRRPIERRCGNALHSESALRKREARSLVPTPSSTESCDALLLYSALFGACDLFWPSQSVARPARDKPIC